MHYTGMAAARHVSTGEAMTGSAAVAEPFALGLGIGAATIFILGLALVGSFVSGRFALKSRKLEESEQLYSSLFLHNPDAVYSADLQGCVTAVNPAAEILTGCPTEELLGMVAEGLAVPEEREMVTHRFKLAARGKAQTYEIALRNKAGERVEVSVTSLPTVVAGEIRGVYSIIKDVTVRRRAEREVRELSRYNRNLFEVNLDGLAALNLGGGFEDTNPAMANLANLSHSKLLKTDLPSLAVDPGEARAALRLVRGQGYLRDYPLELKRRGDRAGRHAPVPVLLDATLFRDESGEVAGILVSVRDSRKGWSPRGGSRPPRRGIGPWSSRCRRPSTPPPSRTSGA